MELTYHKHPASIENTQSEKDRYNSSQGVEMELGLIMILIGFLGLFWPGFLGLALTIVHCLILAITGLVAVWSGMTMERKKVFYVSLLLAIFYLLNTVIGYLIGEEGTPRFGFFTDQNVIQRVAPGFLELSIYDHLMHLILSAGFFLVAYNSKTQKNTIHPNVIKYKGTITFISTIIFIIFMIIFVAHQMTKQFNVQQ